MHNLDPLWLLLAGFGGGLCGSVAGLASLVSYPALLATGLSPVSANVTNTVALIFSSVGSVSASRPELQGQRARLAQLAPAALAGGGLGALLLLVTPSSAFARLVPWLIGAGAIAVVVPRRPPSSLPPHTGRSRALLTAGVFFVAVYGGYFGAAAGVVLLALALHSTGETLARSTALRNLLMGMANLAAAVGFAIWGPVHWADAVPLGIGCLCGARLGPRIVRTVPATPLRLVISCAGLGLAVHLGLDAYR